MKNHDEKLQVFACSASKKGAPGGTTGLTPLGLDIISEQIVIDNGNKKNKIA